MKRSPLVFLFFCLYVLWVSECHRVGWVSMGLSGSHNMEQRPPDEREERKKPNNQILQLLQIRWRRFFASALAHTNTLLELQKSNPQEGNPENPSFQSDVVTGSKVVFEATHLLTSHLFIAATRGSVLQRLCLVGFFLDTHTHAREHTHRQVTRVWDNSRRTTCGEGEAMRRWTTELPVKKKLPLPVTNSESLTQRVFS